MKQIIRILVNKDGTLFRYGHVRVNEQGEIFHHYGNRSSLKHNTHDSYHKSGEFHAMRSQDYAGLTRKLLPYEKITAPFLFANTTALFESFRKFSSTPTQKDIVLSTPADVTHPIIGVYLEPARSYMVRRTQKAIHNVPGTTLSVQTRRLTSLLDVTVAYAWVPGVTMGGLLTFPPQLTSQDLRQFLR